MPIRRNELCYPQNLRSSWFINNADNLELLGIQKLVMSSSLQRYNLCRHSGPVCHISFLSNAVQLQQ